MQLSHQDLRRGLLSVLTSHAAMDATQVQELKRHPKVLFLLDGYDELRGGVSSHDNLYRALKASAEFPNAKFIVTCRTHHLTEEARGAVFSVAGQPSPVLQRYLVPFSQHGITEYIRRRTHDGHGGTGTPLLSEDEYLHELEASSSLRELVRAPFVLRLFVEALPQMQHESKQRGGLHAAPATLFGIYRAFVTQWYQNEITRGTTVQHTPQPQAAGAATVHERLSLSEFCTYCEELAWQMYVQDTLVVRPPGGDLSAPRDAAYHVYLRLEQTVLANAKAERQRLRDDAAHMTIDQRRALEAMTDRCAHVAFACPPGA